MTYRLELCHQNAKKAIRMAVKIKRFLKKISNIIKFEQLHKSHIKYSPMNVSVYTLH